MCGRSLGSRDSEAEALDEAWAALDECCRANGDGAGADDGEAVGLRELRHVDIRARAVGVVHHAVDALIEPVPEQHAGGRLCHQHAHRAGQVRRHLQAPAISQRCPWQLSLRWGLRVCKSYEAAHPARQEHLLVGHRVDRRLLDLPRPPHLSVAHAVGELAGRLERLQLLHRFGELRVRGEHQAEVGHLPKVQQRE